ncbi:MAG TPA: hypothetical protein VMU75_07150 [Acidimicrobiales bacterium]|nr:hypothetical protein [Acidimicrobiales bacterium]
MTTTAPSSDHVFADWFASRLDPAWFEGVPDVQVDDEEILVVGRLAPTVGPPAGAAAAGAADEGGRGSPPGDEQAELARIAAFREETRDQRMAIARDAERVFGRTVSWGASCGGSRRLFTHLSVPVMTRLRLPERAVLDTLVESGVARSRSDAVAWCVRLVAQHETAWLAELTEALGAVRRVRAGGPGRR